MVVSLPDGSAWDAIGKVFRRLELGDSEFLPAFYAAARGRQRRRRAETTSLSRSRITGELDLHAFAPRDIPSVVEEYVRACRERGILRLRLVHGRGRGVQRAEVQRVLRRLEDVASFTDAPPETGGWGATLVELRA